MTATEFAMWLTHAAPGATAVYFSGDSLARARGVDVKHKTAAQEAAHAVGNAAWQAYERGAVTLVQRRHGFANYDFIAVKSSQK